ncbi:MAG: FAD-binding and (Fe-S)-binding domain-containing protein [Coxiellaceae bacterium]|nr:FAD-binding and (Fe-S)-binding domain-containing protein [Coxiellaceae bacterium]
MSPPNPIETFIETLQANGFDGDIETDLATRLLNATDNSVYQIMPLAVVMPKHAQDIQTLCQLIHQPEYKRLAVTARGGGTGTNGQSLSESIIVDCSKYMNGIGELNLEKGFVKVQPGVVLDQLNDFLRPRGVFFAPTLSTSNRATLGGMTNTDACGKGSLLYGKTSQHVLAITAVYSDGSQHTSQACSLDQLDKLKQQSSLLGNIYRQVDDTVCRCKQTIDQQFPTLTRFMTGYDLKHVYNDRRDEFNLNSILCGSEGTLAIITELTLKLTAIPKHTDLMVLQYESFELALQHAKQLLSIKPAAIETIDHTILECAKTDIIYDQVKNFVYTPSRTTAAINYVELVSNDNQQQQTKLQQLTQLIEQHDSPCFNATLATATQDIKNLWELRKKSVGLLAKTPGRRQPVSGIEDTVVPPEKLADYMKEFCALLDAHALKYGIFGHADTGCLHVRPAYDLTNPDDEKLYFEITEQVAELVQKYGGLMWGEHGKGMRSQYVPMFFGDKLYDELRKIKQAFDPHHQFNPGKIATPYNSNETVVSLQSTLRADYNRDIHPSDSEPYHKALSCNGNAACFNYDYNSAMCPSYKASRDRCYSPKGRATLLREWLRQKSMGVDEAFQDQVFDSMDHCLGCKACATGCPVNINIPNEKSKFLQDYYQFNSPSLADNMIIHSEIIAKHQSQWPRLSSAISKLPLFNWFTKTCFELTDLPIVSSPNLLQRIQHKNIASYDLSALQQLSPTDKHVVIIQDSLTSFYEAELVMDCLQLLQQLSFKPLLFNWFSNGKPLHVKGMRDDFKQLAQINADALSTISQLKLPMVGIDPSITLSYQDEYPDMLGPVKFRVQLIQQWLNQQPISLQAKSPDMPLLLLAHCTEATQSNQNTLAWQQLFNKFGLSLNIGQVGCCGMAGSYGYETKHLDNSKKLFDMSWQQHMSDDHVILATGFSCRCQIKRCSEQQPLHPISFLLEQLTAPS